MLTSPLPSWVLNVQHVVCSIAAPSRRKKHTRLGGAAKRDREAVPSDDDEDDDDSGDSSGDSTSTGVSAQRRFRDSSPSYRCERRSPLYATAGEVVHTTMAVHAPRKRLAVTRRPL